MRIMLGIPMLGTYAYLLLLCLFITIISIFNTSIFKLCSDKMSS